MSRQEIKKNYNEAEEKNFDISQEIQEEETRHMDYIYMVNGDKLIIRMNAEQIGRAQRLNSSHNVASRMPSSA